MITINDIQQLRTTIKNWRQQGLSIAFVPTMGNLHTGHISLIAEAHKHADKVIASIFINPMQFGANEDIGNYPRTLQDDQEKLISANTDALFTPTPEIMYPKGLEKQTFVEVPNVSSVYCGESRPGHFRGVSTIVCKLFNLVQPDFACFGLKDYQQVQVIQSMVEDLSLPITIIEVATQRESSGLALSSRNGYLTPDEKATAPILYQTLTWLAQQLRIKPRSESLIQSLIEESTRKINQTEMKVDYIHICHARTLKPATHQDKDLVILAAAHCGKARLIDNLKISL